jgi:hypothetical protein
MTNVQTHMDRPQLSQRDREPAVQSRGVLPWLSVLAFATIAGAFAWAINNPENPSAPATLVQPEPSPSPQDDTKLAISSLREAQKNTQSREQEASKSISEQMSPLGARLDNLERARAEFSLPTKSTNPKEQHRLRSAHARPHFHSRDRGYNSHTAWLGGGGAP